MSTERVGRRRAWTGAGALGLLALLAVPLGAHDSEPQTTAIAPAGAGQLAMLDMRSLFLVDPRTGGSRKLSTFGPFFGADLTVAPVERGGDQIFVTMILGGTSSSLRTRLARFDLAGRLTGEWLSYGGGAAWTGPAVEPDGRTAYVANSRRPEIYRINLTQSLSAPAHLATVRSAETLGAMVLDARRRRLLVTDPFQGLLLEVPLTQAPSKAPSKILLADLGEPYALALDAAADRLFIADAAEGSILVAGLGQPSLKARTFARVPGLQQPKGLALAPDGTLWVLDSKTATLFQLSGTGTLLRKLKPAGR
jgi:DNA-binding beta-propeller fold protein YncE